MKFTTSITLVALAGTALALPADQLERRATCTAFGFSYFCAGTGTTTAAAATSTAVAATTAAMPSVGTTATAAAASSTPTSGGSSTGGATEYSNGATASDIDDNTGCTALTVVFARGTSESGNIGSVAGPPMFKQLIADLGASAVTLQGVNYAADVAGVTSNCGAAGGSEMADEVKTILARCPNTTIALSGYSQGACVVHNAAASQGLDASSIGAVVLFGDPLNGQAVGSVPLSKVLEICASGDQICNGSGTLTITQAHLTYGDNAAQAATFIEGQTGV